MLQKVSAKTATRDIFAKAFKCRSVASIVKPVLILARKRES